MINEFVNNIKNKWEQRYSLKEKIKEKIKEYRFIIKPFLYIAIIFAIGISAIIRADFNYCDDLRRVAKGYVGWENYSRFASCFLSTFIHADEYLTDISPLPQLLAVCIMAISGVIILYTYKNEKKFSVWDIIAIIPIGLSPLFLECFSYKYDAPYMAISVFASVFPLIFRKKNELVYALIIVLSTLLMCMTYQAASGIFLMLLLLICLKNWNEGESFKEIFRTLTISVGSFLVALLIFKTFIMIPTESYVSNTILPFNELIPGTIQHLKEYFSWIKTGFKQEWLIMIGLMAISFIYVMVRDSKRKKYIALPTNIIILAMMALLSFGMYPILTTPLFAPRAMYGFDIFIALMGIAISASKKAYPAKIIVFVLSWMFIVFSFTYGNALKVQDEYTDFRVNLVIEDLNDLEIMQTKGNKIVQISGSIGYSPIIKNMPEDYQILYRLVPVQFRGDWYWGKYYFYNYFKLNNIKQNASRDLTKYDLPVLKDTMYHTIKGNEENILIKLK